jgi:predicted dehydrogenase
MKVLVVGLGSVGRRHLANLVALGVARVEACSEWQRLRHYSVGDVCVPVHHRFEEALRSLPDAVVIANPTSLHARYAAQAIDRGCHVYVEKPAAVSRSDVRGLVEQALTRRVVAAVGCQLRFNDCLERLRRKLAAGYFGRLVSVQINQGEHLQAYHPAEDYRTSYAARAKLGGGILLTQIHEINYLRWIFGEPAAAFAIGGKTSRLEIDVDDSVTALLTLRDGTPVTLHQDFLQQPARRSVAVFGEAATAFWDYGQNTLRLVTAHGVQAEDDEAAPLDRNRMFRRAMMDFLECVQHPGRSPRTTLRDACADLAVVDAIRASFATQRLERIHGC